MAELLAAPWVDNTPSLDVNGVQVDRNKYPALQHNAVRIKGQHRIIPKHIVVKVTINQHPAQALLDSGSLGDFISSTLADQLKLQRQTLDTPLALQLVVQGLRSKVNATTSAQLKYQGIDEQCTFDIINLSSYDKEVDETDLPPFRIINHTIPLIDESKIYPWWLPKCPEAFRAQWAEKRDAYVKSGCWQITSAGNTVPMLLIPKPGTNPPLLQTVVDLRE